ncbi:protocatechuate 3,4-dioxygenase beta subunit [Chryseolinea serpens]|uniref:Protocatechuate 3,4-dioxygenase beta subunit n=1 Tax=Chryseolinea serpens TaxID=947013 RepID=A0A1M5TD89_9BACT|nr:protocatechuate 3,4-dioxygenase subunit beta [Chryseolinea serpens]SHH48674.1 protocatechuate 3,4-dioxygenase beta subunit [Chryseolinea serpens]
MDQTSFDVHPPHLYAPYKSTILRSPTRPLMPVRELLKDLTLPAFGESLIGKLDNDLTKNARKNGEPIGERIKVSGVVMDEYGKPLAGVLVEIWQANSAGRYVHKEEIHDAPLDPNFLGAGRILTDREGRYSFYTIKPGAYPWGNHFNAWRPNHIHFSVVGHQFEHRLVTQMYFQGDPLFEYDPIFQSVPVHARELLIAKFRMDWTEPEFALAYEFNIILGRRSSTPFE